MSILVDERTTLVVQGITGNEGTFHTLRNRDYGTNVVAGVTPGKGGQDVEGIPVFDTVARAVAETGADTSMIFVPPRFAAEAILEAADAGVGLVVCITEGIPVRDMANVRSYLEASKTRLVGPELPRRDLAGRGQRGDHPRRDLRPGRRRARLEERHARVSDRARAHAARHRSVHLRGHGRRSRSTGSGSSRR